MLFSDLIHQDRDQITARLAFHIKQARRLDEIIQDLASPAFYGQVDGLLRDLRQCEEFAQNARFQNDPDGIHQ